MQKLKKKKIKISENRKQREIENEKIKILLIEEITILKAKILQLRNLSIEDNLLKNASEILKNKTA